MRIWSEKRPPTPSSPCRLCRGCGWCCGRCLGYLWDSKLVRSSYSRQFHCIASREKAKLTITSTRQKRTYQITPAVDTYLRDVQKLQYINWTKNTFEDPPGASVLPRACLSPSQFLLETGEWQKSETKLLGKQCPRKHRRLPRPLH